MDRLTFPAMDAALATLDEGWVDGTVKGLAPRLAPLRLSAVGSQNWNLLEQDLAFPVAVIKSSALENNRAWMKAFLRHTGAQIAPHAKTTMAPHLFRMQLEDGAWALSAATANQVAVLLRYKVPRIVVANQVMGRENIALLFDELERDDGAELLTIVDSDAGLDALIAGSQGRILKRPLGLLVEVGSAGGRTGMRDPEAALALCRRIAESGGAVVLRGIEAYESVFPNLSPEDRLQRIEDMLQAMLRMADQCRDANLFSPGEVVLSAGGSEYFDIVIRRLQNWKAQDGMVVLIRSGCYLAHDHLAYARAFDRMLERDPMLSEIARGLEGALEVWGVVQSCPEPGVAIVTVGKRDISFDFELPSARAYHRLGSPHAAIALSDHVVTRLNDQHAFVRCPDQSPLQVGDLVAFGISHPCTTFDKWSLIAVVDDDYRVVSAIRTFF